MNMYMLVVVVTPVTHSKQATTSACLSPCYITASSSNMVRAVGAERMKQWSWDLVVCVTSAARARGTVRYATNTMFRRSSGSIPAHLNHKVAPLLHILWMEILNWSFGGGGEYNNDHIRWTSWRQPGVPCCPQSRSPKPVKYNPDSIFDGHRLKEDALVYWDYFYNMALA